MLRFGPEGRPDPTFGDGDGISPLEGVGTFPFLGFDAADRPAVGVESVAAGPCHIAIRVYRFGAEGEPLAAFGPGGAQESGSVQPELVEPSGAILLGGRYGRLLPYGRVDRSFGRHGWLFTHLLGRRELISTQASLDSGGRLLVAGIVTRPHHLDGAFTVARYLLGP